MSMALVEDFHDVDWRAEKTRGHDGKTCYPNPPAARAAAVAATERTGEQISPYRCPWVPGSRHWHIGHVLSEEGLQRHALALRAFHDHLANGGDQT